MKTRILLFFILLSSSIYAQDVIQVSITDECEPYSGEYTFVDVINDKNHYQRTVNVNGTDHTLDVSYLEIELGYFIWVYAIDNEITYYAEYMPNTLAPPFEGWENIDDSTCQGSLSIRYEPIEEDAIVVLITENCAIISGVYSLSGMLNGKNNYYYRTTTEEEETNFKIGFDGTKWILYMEEDITDPGFINNNTVAGVLLPNTGWEVVENGCESGTLIIEGGYNLDTPLYSIKQFDVFPNPATNILYCNTDKNIEYQIIDIQGRVILKGFTQGSIEIDTLQNGIYLLKLDNYSMKFIKE